MIVISLSMCQIPLNSCHFWSLGIVQWSKMALIEGDLPIDRDVTNIYVTITFHLSQFFSFSKKAFKNCTILKNGPQNYSYIDNSNYSYIDNSTSPSMCQIPLNSCHFWSLGIVQWSKTALIEGDLPIDRDVTNIYVTITFSP